LGGLFDTPCSRNFAPAVLFGHLCDSTHSIDSSDTMM
jgi:hypothetical protein